MQLIASKKEFPIPAALAFLFALTLSLQPVGAQFGTEAGGIYSAGGSSEGGGAWASGSSTESGGAAGSGSITESGGVFNSGSTTEGGGVNGIQASTEGGGFQNSGASSESGLGVFQYVPPNPHAWSTYTGTKAPAPWGTASLSGSGGMVSAGSEKEAQSTSPDSIGYSNIKADTASTVHYYGK